MQFVVLDVTVHHNLIVSSYSYEVTWFLLYVIYILRS